MKQVKIFDILGVLFLTIVVGISSLVIANPNNLQLIGSYAKTSAKHAAKLAADRAANFQSYVDSKIRKAEKASKGACDGWRCVVTPYSQTSAGKTSSTNSGCDAYYIGQGVPADQASAQCATEAPPQTNSKPSATTSTSTLACRYCQAGVCVESHSDSCNASLNSCTSDANCANSLISGNFVPQNTGNSTQPLSLGTCTPACKADEECISVGEGYYGCQKKSTITNPSAIAQTQTATTYTTTTQGSCTPGAARCSGNNLQVCSTSGWVTNYCPNGCSGNTCNPAKTVTPSDITSAKDCASRGWYWDLSKNSCSTTPTTSIAVAPGGNVSVKSGEGGACQYTSDCADGLICPAGGGTCQNTNALPPATTQTTGLQPNGGGCASDKDCASGSCGGFEVNDIGYTRQFCTDNPAVAAIQKGENIPQYASCQNLTTGANSAAVTASCNYEKYQLQQGLNQLSLGQFNPYVQTQQELNAQYGSPYQDNGSPQNNLSVFTQRTFNTRNFVASTNLGTTIVAEGAFIYSGVGALTTAAGAGSLGGVIGAGGKLLTQTMAIQAEQSTGTYAACVAEKGAGNCSEEAGSLAISWANVITLGIAGKVAAPAAKILSTSLSFANAGYTGYQAVKTCRPGETFNGFSCVTNVVFTAAAAYSGVNELKDVVGTSIVGSLNKSFDTNPNISSDLTNVSAPKNIIADVPSQSDTIYIKNSQAASDALAQAEAAQKIPPAPSDQVMPGDLADNQAQLATLKERFKNGIQSEGTTTLRTADGQVFTGDNAVLTDLQLNDELARAASQDPAATINSNSKAPTAPAPIADVRPTNNLPELSINQQVAPGPDWEFLDSLDQPQSQSPTQALNAKLADATDPLFAEPPSTTGVPNNISRAAALADDIQLQENLALSEPSAPVNEAPTVAQNNTQAAPATTSLKPWEATPEQLAAENTAKQKVMSGQQLNTQDQQVLDQAKIRFQALTEASPLDAAAMTEKDFQNWLNPKLGSIRSGDLQAASDAFEANRLRGDEFGMRAIADEVASLATVDVTKIEDLAARTTAESKAQQAAQLLGQMDTEIAQANISIPTNIEGPYVKIPESNNPITTAIDVAPGSQSPTFDNLVNSYETGGKSAEAAYNNALSDSEQMRNWLGANTNNGDIIAAKNGDFYVKRGAYWEQINSDGTLNNQVKIVESDQGNIALSGGQIVAQGSKVNFAPLSASAKEQLVQNLIDKAPNDGISPEVFFSSLISDGYPPDEITVKLYDDAMAAVNQRYGNTNFLTQARTTLDEAINGSRTLETGAAQAENSAAAAAAPTNELAPAPAAPAAETATTQTSRPNLLEQIFGQRKTLTLTTNSTGEITLKPGDTVIWNGHTNTIPDPSVVKTDIYWQVVNGDSLPQKLTPAGITVDISKSPVIEFGSLDPSGRTIDDTVAGITESLGNTRGTPAQIVLSGDIAKPSIITRANPEPGVLADAWNSTKTFVTDGFNNLIGRGTETGGAVNVAEKAQAVEQANPSVVQNVRNYFKGVLSGFDNDVVKPIGDALLGKPTSEVPAAPATEPLAVQAPTKLGLGEQIFGQAKTETIGPGVSPVIGPGDEITLNKVTFINGNSASEPLQTVKIPEDGFIKVSGIGEKTATYDMANGPVKLNGVTNIEIYDRGGNLLNTADTTLTDGSKIVHTNPQQGALANTVERVKNFLTNPQPSEAGGGITVRSSQLPPPEPGVYHPVSANPDLSGMEIKVNGDGTAYIKTNLNTPSFSDVFVPLKDGEGIPGLSGGKVVKVNDNYIYISDTDAGLTATNLTGKPTSTNILQRILNTANDNNASKTVINDLIAKGQWPGSNTSVAEDLLRNGYSLSDINAKNVNSVVNDFQNAYYLKFPEKAPPITFTAMFADNFISGFLTGVSVGGGAGIGYETYANRDIVLSYLENLTQPGYYSPLLGTRIVEKNGKWYRVDNGEEIESAYNVSYLTGSVIEYAFDFKAFQHDTVNQATFQSIEWKNFSNNVAMDTNTNSSDITLITSSIHNNMTYNYNLNKNFYGYVYTDRNLQNALNNNVTICFEFAAAEQAYLAQMGIPSQMSGASVDFNDGQGRIGHAFLVITDKNGEKWIADPTNNWVMTYTEYVDKYKVQDFVDIPQIYNFTNPSNPPFFTIEDNQQQTQPQSSIQAPAANTFQNVANFMQENVTSPIADSIQTNQTNITTPEGKPLGNFDIFLQKSKGYQSIEGDQFGGNWTQWGCGPSTSLNIQNLYGMDTSVSKVTGSYLWTSAGSSGDGVLLNLQRNGFPSDTYSYGVKNRITDASALTNYTGVLVYGGTVSSPDEKGVAHIAAFDCQNGKCMSIDSYFSDGKPVSCTVENANNIKCGSYNYHVGPVAGGSPDALFPVKAP